MHEVVGGGVFGMVGHHGADDGQIIHTAGHVREEFADGGPALAVLFEVVGRAEDLITDVEDGGGRLERELLAVVETEAGLGVERVHLRGATVHEQEDDGFGLRGMMRAVFCGGLGEHLHQGQTSEAVGCPAQELPSIRHK